MSRYGIGTVNPTQTLDISEGPGRFVFEVDDYGGRTIFITDEETEAYCPFCTSRNIYRLTSTTSLHNGCAQCGATWKLPGGVPAEFANTLSVRVGSGFYTLSISSNEILVAEGHEDLTIVADGNVGIGA